MRTRAVFLFTVLTAGPPVAAAAGPGSLLASIPAAASSTQGGAAPSAPQAAAPADAGQQVNPEVEPTAPNQRLLTLEEAIQIAATQSRDLLAAREHLRMLYSDVERARSALLPTVTAQGKLTINAPEVSLTLDQSGSVFGSAYQGAQIADLNQNAKINGMGPFSSVLYQQYCTDPNQPLGVQQVCQQLSNPAKAAASLPTSIAQANIQATIVPQLQLDGLLAANIPLVVPSAYPALSGAKLTFKAAEKQLEVTTTQVLTTVASAFYRAAGLEEVVVARSNAISVVQKTLDDARIRLSAGVANRVDVSRAEQAVLRSQQDLLEAQGNRGTAYRQLATQLKLQPGSIKIVPPPEPPAELPADSQLVSQALAQRPEIANLDLTQRAAGQQVKAAWMKWAPTLSGFGNIRLTNATGFAGRIDYYAIGLQLDWTIFDGFVRDAQRHQFEAQRRENLLRLDLQREQVSDDVIIARNNILIRRRGLASAQSSVRLAKETLDLVRVQYEAGTATQLDLLTAQDKLVQADVALAQARFDISLSALDLRRATGESLGSK